MKKVSIVIPVYKVEPYIERCVRSVMSQTYTNLECILVDDCGLDKSIEIVERIICNYEGPIEFRIVHHEHNRGLSAARNTGFDNMHGEYVYFLDSDDALIENAIEVMYNWVMRYPDVEMVVAELSNLRLKNGTWVDEGYFFDYRGTNVGYVDNHEWIVRHCFDYKQNVVMPVNGVNKLIRKDFFKKNNLYFKEGLTHEDERWLFDISKYLHKVAFCEDITYMRYINAGSIMTCINKYNSLHSWFVILEDVFPNLNYPCLEIKKNYCYSIAVERYLSISQVYTTHRCSLIFQYKRLLLMMLGDAIKNKIWQSAKVICFSLLYPQCIRSPRVNRWFLRRSKIK